MNPELRPGHKGVICGIYVTSAKRAKRVASVLLADVIVDKKEATSSSKGGVARPLIIPKYDEIDLDIITTLIRTAGIMRDTFLALWPNAKGLLYLGQSHPNVPAVNRA